MPGGVAGATSFTGRPYADRRGATEWGPRVREDDVKICIVKLTLRDFCERANRGKGRLRCRQIIPDSSAPRREPMLTARPGSTGSVVNGDNVNRQPAQRRFLVLVPVSYTHLTLP